MTEFVGLRSRSLARSALRLTELSLGCAQLGNLYRAVTDDQAGATVGAAWDREIRYFDTAPHYGLGLSERRLGLALAGRPRGEYVLSTKVGRRLEPLSPSGQLDDEGFDVEATHRRVWDFSRDGVMRSLEESLRRLGVLRLCEELAQTRIVTRCQQRPDRRLRAHGVHDHERLAGCAQLQEGGLS